MIGIEKDVSKTMARKVVKGIEISRSTERRKQQDEEE